MFHISRWRIRLFCNAFGYLRPCRSWASAASWTCRSGSVWCILGSRSSAGTKIDQEEFVRWLSLIWSCYLCPISVRSSSRTQIQRCIFDDSLGMASSKCQRGGPSSALYWEDSLSYFFPMSCHLLHQMCHQRMAAGQSATCQPYHLWACSDRSWLKCAEGPRWLGSASVPRSLARTSRSDKAWDHLSPTFFIDMLSSLQTFQIRNSDTYSSLMIVSFRAYSR